MKYVIKLLILMSFVFCNRVESPTSLDLYFFCENKNYYTQYLNKSSIQNLQKIKITGMSHNERLCESSNFLLQEICRKSTKIEEISMIYCNLNNIPKVIGNLNNLSYLDLSDNINIDVKYLYLAKEIVRLNLNGCYLDRLPENISELKKLKFLGLEGNNFSDIEKQKIKNIFPNTRIYF